MLIRYALLGLLSWRPMTGYDIKKVVSESATMYWSGNNNQIYTALVQLCTDGLVSRDVQFSETSPTKKVYSVTDGGRAELRQWVLSTPETLEVRNTFLIQLAWADALDSGELDGLLGRYEQEVGLQLMMHEEKRRRGAPEPGRTARESLLWEAIDANIRGVYERELAWVQKLRLELSLKWGNA